MKFKDFQAPVLFSSTFKALNSGEKNSSTFKDAWEPCSHYGIGLVIQWSWVRSPATTLSVSWYRDGWPFSGGYTPSVCSQPSRPTQLHTLCGTGNEYRPKCGDAVQLDGSFHSWISVWVADKTLWSLVNTRHSEHFRGEYTHKKALYKCP